MTLLVLSQANMKNKLRRNGEKLRGCVVSFRFERIYSDDVGGYMLSWTVLLLELPKQRLRHPKKRIWII